LEEKEKGKDLGRLKEVKRRGFKRENIWNWSGSENYARVVSSSQYSFPLHFTNLISFVYFLPLPMLFLIPLLSVTNSISVLGLTSSWQALHC